MQLTPRYDGPPILDLGTPAADPAVPLLRQRRRFAATLARLDVEQWAAPSRCAEWSVQDVVSHLVGTNQFWVISITNALAGTPTRYLDSFDPVATPLQMVDAMRSSTADDVLARFDETNAEIAELVSGLDDAGWSAIGEAPPGHIALYGVALHALWDSWIHERDVVIPLGMEPVEEADEVAACLRYALALGPGFLAMGGSTRSGALAADARDPHVQLTVALGETVVVRDGLSADDAVVLRGSAVDLVEALSFRGAVDLEVAPDDQWVLGGLGAVFDQT